MATTHYPQFPNPNTSGQQRVFPFNSVVDKPWPSLTGDCFQSVYPTWYKYSHWLWSAAPDLMGVVTLHIAYELHYISKIWKLWILKTIWPQGVLDKRDCGPEWRTPFMGPEDWWEQLWRTVPSTQKGLSECEQVHRPQTRYQTTKVKIAFHCFPAWPLMSY